MPIEPDNENYCEDFVRLNEAWISEHSNIEQADRDLAADPFKIARNGGYIVLAL